MGKEIFISSGRTQGGSSQEGMILFNTIKSFYTSLLISILFIPAISYAHEKPRDQQGCHLVVGSKIKHCHLTQSDISLPICNFAGSKVAKYRGKNYKHWIDEDKDGLNTRHEVLYARSESSDTIVEENKKGTRAKVIRGRWHDVYTGDDFTNPNKIKVLHLVPLKEAHISGAWLWSSSKKKEYANDLKNESTLVAVYKNTYKGRKRKDPARWLPKGEELYCQYTKQWVNVKSTWDLCYDEAEVTKIIEIYKNCSKLSAK